MNRTDHFIATGCGVLIDDGTLLPWMVEDEEMAIDCSSDDGMGAAVKTCVVRIPDGFPGEKILEDAPPYAGFGRPCKADSDKKSEILHMRVTEIELERIRYAAKYFGHSVPGWVRAVLLAASGD